LVSRFLKKNLKYLVGGIAGGTKYMVTFKISDPKFLQVNNIIFKFAVANDLYPTDDAAAKVAG
jgi:hypothetical protein